MGHMYIYIYIYMYICVYVYIYMNMCVYVYMHICVCIYVCICICACICICICMCMCMGYRNFRRPLQLVARRSVDVVRRSQCRWAPSNPNIIYSAKSRKLWHFFNFAFSVFAEASKIDFASRFPPRHLEDSRRRGPPAQFTRSISRVLCFPFGKAQNSRGF